MPLQPPPSGRGLRKARPERMQKQTRGAGLRGAKLRPAAPLRAQIQNSLRPAASIPLEASPQPSGRACFRAARDCSPPPGGGCGLLRSLPEPQIQNSIFKIQNDEIGSQPAEVSHEADLRDASCGPPPPGGYGPHGLFKAEVPLCRFNLCPRAFARAKLRPADRSAIE